VHPYEVLCRPLITEKNTSLCRPLITEKNTSLQALGKYAFEVAGDANKHQVKEAVEKAFKVKRHLRLK